MLFSRLLTGARQSPDIYRRHFGMCIPALQKVSDPIQQLFLDKVREYKQKSSGGKLVEPSPDIQKELKSELERTARIYGQVGGANMEEFPSFSFKDPVVDIGTEAK